MPIYPAPGCYHTLILSFLWASPTVCYQKATSYVALYVYMQYMMLGIFMKHVTKFRKKDFLKLFCYLWWPLNVSYIIILGIRAKQYGSRQANTYNNNAERISLLRTGRDWREGEFVMSSPVFMKTSELFCRFLCCYKHGNLLTRSLWLSTGFSPADLSLTPHGPSTSLTLSVLNTFYSSWTHWTSFLLDSSISLSHCLGSHFLRF